MRKLILSILILTFGFTRALPQDLLGFENIARNESLDYKNSEKIALGAASFLLSTAIDSAQNERDKAVTYMLMWMEGTPDYVFYIDENVNFLTRSNNSLLAIYMAGLTKLSLENPELSNKRNDIKYRSLQLFIQYCSNPAYHVKTYKQLERLIKANEKGRLSDYIE
jgi:hypothetical protein